MSELVLHPSDLARAHASPSFSNPNGYALVEDVTGKVPEKRYLDPNQQLDGNGSVRPPGGTPQVSAPSTQQLAAEKAAADKQAEIERQRVADEQRQAAEAAQSAAVEAERVRQLQQQAAPPKQ